MEALRCHPTALTFRVPNERCADGVRALHGEFMERT
jgi:hypothetical protein